MTLRVRKYSWSLAPRDIREIRQRVFVQEQSVPQELEWDDSDEIADHYLALLPDNTPVGTARLFSTLEETAHIGRMAILPAHRGKGFGAALLQHLLTENGQRYRDFHLSAQTHAIEFYQRQGFHVCSEEYDDAGIPHVDMQCLAPDTLAEAFESGDHLAHPFPMILGEDEKAWLFSDEPRIPGLMDAVAGQARQRVWIYDRLLSHTLYDRPRFREILSALARRHRLSEVRILVHDDKPLVKRRHCIVELLKRLPTHMELKLVNSDFPVEGTPFLLADREGLVYRHDFHTPDGFAGFAHGRRVKPLEDAFQRMWDTARPSIELRDLPL